MSDPTRTPAEHAEAHASWHDDSPVPAAAETRLQLQLESLRSLSAVRRQVQRFLLSSLSAGRTGMWPRPSRTPSSSRCSSSTS